MRRLCIISLIIFTVANIQTVLAEEPASVDGQTPQNLPHREFRPRFRGRAVVLEINTRLVEQNQTVVWNESHLKVTLFGRPVEIKLVGGNIVVIARFTPYMRRGMQCYLVAQGQVWMETPDQGIRYHTAMQTIPVKFGEQIYFFPLGPIDDDAARIEMMLVMRSHNNEEN